MNKNIIVRKIILYVPSQNPNSLTNINATLGQNGVNSFEFFKQFNNLSKIYLEDIVLNVELVLYVDKKFDIIIKGPTNVFMFYEEYFCSKGGDSMEFQFPDNIYLNLSALYKIAVFQKEIGKNKVSLKSIFKSLLGTLKTTTIKIINDVN